MADKTIILRADLAYSSAVLSRISDPDAALLYLYLNSHGGKAVLSAACDYLKIPESRLARAFEVLIMHGVAANEGSVPVKPPPEPDPEELASLREGDADFRSVCTYFEHNQGRILRRNELETLCSLYYDLALKSDLFILMLNYVKSVKEGKLSAAEKATAEVKVSIREIERLAYEWYDAGIRTYSDGEAYIIQLQEKHGRVAEVMRLFGFFGRRPSDSEREYIEKWIGMGFGDDMLKLAYETTVNRLHEVSFPYLNAILERWNAAGIKTPETAASSKFIPEAKVSPEAAVTAMFEKKRHDRELLRRKRLEDLTKKSRSFAENEKQIRLLSSRAARASGDARKQLEAERDRLIAERKTILSGEGLPEDWLDIKPDCPICRDYGYVGQDMCECFKKAVRQLQKGYKG